MTSWLHHAAHKPHAASLQSQNRDAVGTVGCQPLRCSIRCAPSPYSLAPENTVAFLVLDTCWDALLSSAPQPGAEASHTRDAGCPLTEQDATGCCPGSEVQQQHAEAPLEGLQPEVAQQAATRPAVQHTSRHG